MQISLYTIFIGVYFAILGGLIGFTLADRQLIKWIEGFNTHMQELFKDVLSSDNLNNKRAKIELIRDHFVDTDKDLPCDAKLYDD